MVQFSLLSGGRALYNAAAVISRERTFEAHPAGRTGICPPSVKSSDKLTEELVAEFGILGALADVIATDHVLLGDKSEPGVAH